MRAGARDRRGMAGRHWLLARDRPNLQALRDSPGGITKPVDKATNLGRWICGAGLALLLGSCRSMAPDTPDASSSAATEDGVRQMASSIARDLAQDGPNAWLRYFVDGREFFMANDGRLQFSNFAEAKAFLGSFSVGVAHLELAWGEIRIDPIAPGAAVMGSPYHEVLTDTNGRTVQFSGYFTGLAVETPSGWKLRDAHWSSAASSP
jgi:hypothetical protein